MRWVFALWLSMLLLASGQHVAWRDEFQSWLVASQTRDWSELWMAMRYERTPPLLYLIQRGLAHLPFSGTVAPENWIRISTLPFTVAFGWLWFFRVRGLSRLERILVPFSVFVFREYGVISRSYIHGLLFSSLALVAHQKGGRWWVVIALLLASLSHAIWALIAFGILGWLLWDQQANGRPRLGWRDALSLALVFGVAGVIFANQLPPKDSFFATGISGGWARTLSQGLSALGRAFIALESWESPYQWNSGTFRVGHGLVVLLGLVSFSTVIGLRQARFFSVIALPLLIFGGAYGAQHRQAGLLWAAAWLVSLFFPKGESVPRWRWTLALLPVITTLIWLGRWQPWRSEPRWDHSGSRELVQWFKKDLGERPVVWLADWPPSAFAVMGRLGVPMFDPDHARWLRYPHFIAGRTSGWPEACSVRPFALNGVPVLALVPAGMGPPPRECGQAEKVFETRRPVATDESYTVYRLTQGREWKIQ